MAEPYAASKFGLCGFSNALRREWATLDIGVTYVAPRGAQTDAARRLASVLDRLAMPLDTPAAIATQVWGQPNAPESRDSARDASEIVCYRIDI